MENEIWKEIEEYEGYYEVSNLGRVKSVDRYVMQGDHPFHVKGKILKQHINDQGYPIVILTKKGKSKWTRVHRLVAKAFIPNPDNLPEVDHINTDKKDYRIENLRWVSHRQNMNNEISKKKNKELCNLPHVIKKRLMTAKQKRGKTAPKTVYKYTLSGDYVCSYFSIPDAAKAHNVTKGAISAAIKGENYNCGGFQWRTTFSDRINPFEKRYRTRIVERVDESGNVIGRWSSLASAARDLKIDKTTVSRNIYPNGSKNYKFRYAQMSTK